MTAWGQTAWFHPARIALPPLWLLQNAPSNPSRLPPADLVRQREAGQEEVAPAPGWAQS